LRKPVGAWVPWASGALCAAWALVAWVSVIPNQDILADGIQAQSLVFDPRIVLAFPGQKHGGPLEYPATVFFEWVLPGNYYANAVVRIVLAFLTGFLSARLAFCLFPRTRTWALLTAVALGPTMIHGLQPPGVWWMQPNYDMAWLLVVAGSLLFASNQDACKRMRSRKLGLAFAFLAGLLVGLGLFAHPIIILLAVPLGVLVLLLKGTNLSQLLLLLSGVSLGLAPAVTSYFVNDDLNVWDPSHKPFIYPAWIWNMGRTALGLDGVPDPLTALFPYALGFSPTQEPFGGVLQTLVVILVLLASVIVTVVGVFRSVRSRAWLSPATSLAITWLVVAATMVVYITVADPVSHYSAGLAPLAWISIGALPSLTDSRLLGSSLAIVILIQFGLSSWGQNSSYLTSIPDRVKLKAQTQEDMFKTADALQSEGVEIIFGSYLDAIPIGYASNWNLRTITIKYNRFPLSASEQERDSYRTAVQLDGRGEPAAQALQLVLDECRVVSQSLELPVGTFMIAECPTDTLVLGN